MGTTNMSIGERARRVVLCAVAILLFGVSFTMFAAPSVASAAGCRTVTHFLINPGQDNGVNYLYTQIMTVPSNSPCNDINIRAITELPPNTGHCGNFRVRFYPSSGAVYTNAYQFKCSDPAAGSPLHVIASNVANGTRYRVEAQANWVSRYFDIVD